MKIIRFIIITAALIMIHGCDKGIEPVEENSNSGETGFSGKVTFSGQWPAGIQQTLIAVFKNPINTDQDFYPPNLSYVIGPIPFNSTEYTYNSIESSYSAIFQLAPGEYNYVVVVQSPKADLSFDRKDWTVAGIYCVNGNQNSAAKLVIENGKMKAGVNINVDFGNPPPQPPGG